MLTSTTSHRVSADLDDHDMNDEEFLFSLQDIFTDDCDKQDEDNASNAPHIPFQSQVGNWSPVGIGESRVPSHQELELELTAGDVWGTQVREDEITLQSHTRNLNPLTAKTESKKRKDINWAQAVLASLDLLRHKQPSQEITRTDFHCQDQKSGQIRVCPCKELLKVCKKLPWFHQVNVRFRQTLATKRRHGVTLQDVIVAMNFLFQREYSDDEIKFLGDYFQRMEAPTTAECLTTIVEVSEDFNRYLETTQRQQQFQAMSGKKRARALAELQDTQSHNFGLLQVSERPEVTSVLCENGEMLRAHQRDLASPSSRCR